MRQFAIEVAAGFYSLVVWALIPLGAGALAFWLKDGTPGLRRLAEEGHLPVDKALDLSRRSEKRAIIWALCVFLVVGFVMAWVDSNMHAIVREAHR